jgi:hypothetical protein
MDPAVTVDSGSNARDLLGGHVPPEGMVERACAGCGEALLVNGEHLQNAARVYAQLGLPEPSVFLCVPCARRAEGRAR